MAVSTSTGFMSSLARSLMADTCVVVRTGGSWPCRLVQGLSRPRYLQPEGTAIEVYRLVTVNEADIKVGDTFTHSGNRFAVYLAEQPPPVTRMVQRSFLCFLLTNSDGTSALYVPNATVRGLESDQVTVRYQSRRVHISIVGPPTDVDTHSVVEQPGIYMIDSPDSTWTAQDWIDILEQDNQPILPDTTHLLLRMVDRPAGVDARVIARIQGGFDPHA